MSKLVGKKLFAALLTACVVLTACSSFRKTESDRAEMAAQIIEVVRREIAPDPHLSIFLAGVEQAGGSLVLTGDVQSAEAKLKTIDALAVAGIKVRDKLAVLPDDELGAQTWGIAALSLCNGREKPEHKAELGTQLLMGEIVRVWKRATNGWGAWFLAQSRDGYIAWQAEGNLVRCTRQQAAAWEAGPLVIISAFDATIFSKPDTSSAPLSDAVFLNKVKLLRRDGEWLHVQLPGGETGFLAARQAEDYEGWKQSRQPTASEIERVARNLGGRPYLWGGNSPRGLDCSGFTKVVFASQGIDLMRNASHQARQGSDVPLHDQYNFLKTGDLLFFGRRADAGKQERITHVGIYLGDKQFIHSADNVHISSLDPEAYNRDLRRIDRLLCARRILPERADVVSGK